jgi:hypothetical protein
MLDGRVSSGNTVIEPAFLRANGEGAIVDGMHAADHREALKQHPEVWLIVLFAYRDTHSDCNHD